MEEENQAAQMVSYRNQPRSRTKAPGGEGSGVWLALRLLEMAIFEVGAPAISFSQALRDAKGRTQLSGLPYRDLALPSLPGSPQSFLRLARRTERPSGAGEALGTSVPCHPSEGPQCPLKPPPGNLGSVLPEKQLGIWPVSGQP